MTELSQFRQVFADKLKSGGTFEDAFAKAVWMAYNEGLLAGLSDQRENKSVVVDNVKTILSKGYRHG